LQSVFGSDPKYWSDEMKLGLGIGGFPFELTLNNDLKKRVPAIQFDENPESLGSLLNQELKIFVTLTEYFTTNVRSIIMSKNCHIT
jgi:hypothetical protein